MSDLAVLAADTTALEKAADPATFVVLACERAKVWLTQAVEHGDMDQIVELKSQAEAYRIYTMQKQLGKDAELAAAEIVRRAERGLGVCIRRGQDEGTVRVPGPTAYRPGQQGAVPTMVSPAAVMPNTNERRDVYDVTDGVSDEQFDEAVAEAKEERNLSRANVVRKVASRAPAAAEQRLLQIRDLAGRGHNSRQIAEEVGISEERVRWLSRRERIELADDRIGKTRRIDSNRVMAETVSSLEALTLGVDLLDLQQLDPDEVERWATSLGNSLRSLNRLCRQLKEMTQ